jgi:hypothetical protein
MGPSGVDPNVLLPRTYQNLLDAKTHRESIRGLYGRQAPAQLQLVEHYKSLASGQTEEAYPGEAEMIHQMLVGTRTAPPGSPEQENKQLDVDKKKAQLPYAGRQAAANLAGTEARTEGTQANTETENLLRDARYKKLLAQTILAQKQADLAGNMSGSEKMKQKAIMLNVLKFGMAQGAFDMNDETEIMDYIMGGTGLSVQGEPPSKFRQFFDSILGPGASSSLNVTPSKGAAPGTSQSQSFKGAPPGKAVGAILKDESGKPIGKWDGKAWQAIQ